MSGTLFTAVLIGMAFGAALEQAGLARAGKLAGQFYLADFTVLKVMFSAILTAMLGVFWLTRLGVVAPSDLYVPSTYLLPQATGGLIFGLGFAMCGLCPGTACASAATGRLDGLAVMLGMLAGVLVTGLAFEQLEGFYGSTAMGVFTLPQATGLPDGVVVMMVALAALAVFRLVGWFEGLR